MAVSGGVGPPPPCAHEGDQQEGRGDEEGLFEKDGSESIF